MSLIWITESPGSGKSTVNQALVERGYISYDVDKDGLARWVNLKTGFIHSKSTVKPEDRTSEFIKTHAWYVPRQRVESIHKEAKGKLGFLCGALDNYADIKDLLNDIIALWTEDELVKRRLVSRGPREWGHHQHEVDQTIERHHKVYDQYRSMGAIVIKTDISIAQVVDEVLSSAKSLSNQ